MHGQLTEYRPAARKVGLSVGLICAGLLAVSTLAQPCEPRWEPTIGQPGMNSDVRALAIFDDGGGRGPLLYAGGHFTSAGGVPANYLACWNGREWSALETEVNGAVFALTVFDDRSGGGPALYAGGNFTHVGDQLVNGLAKWDGRQWSPVGGGVTGLSAAVHALCVFDDGNGEALYIGGHFTFAGGMRANHIAKWDGRQWSPLGEGVSGTDPIVLSLQVYNDGTGPALFAGGEFLHAGGVLVFSIAKWSGVQWSALDWGTMLDGIVYALDVFDDGAGASLFVAGSFSSVSGLSVRNIAKWNGAQWSRLRGGVQRPALALAVFEDLTGSGASLYVGGRFETVDQGMRVNHIARWNSSEWTALADGVDNDVHSLCAFTDPDSGAAALVTGGSFATANGMAASRIAEWRGCTRPSLAVRASCPSGGPIRAQWSGAAPGGRVALIFGQSQGVYPVPPNYPCAGTQLGLGSNQLQIAWFGRSDADGGRIINATAPPAACGGFLQLLDLTTCATSNVARVE